MAWQAVVAVAATAYCGWVLLSLPESRRSPGTVATGTGFALLTTLWVLNGASFGFGTHLSGALGSAAQAFADLNAYAATLLNVAMGYAMIVVLMEDAKREVNDAHAELRVSHDRMRRAALLDDLTDSLNRRAFREGVGLEMVRATYGVAVIADLDNLKTVNDRYGHTIGDQVLRHCADVLRSSLRPYDKLYRWGGDEFLLLIASAREGEIAPRLEAALREAAPLPVDGT